MGGGYSTSKSQAGNWVGLLRGKEENAVGKSWHKNGWGKILGHRKQCSIFSGRQWPASRDRIIMGGNGWFLDIVVVEMFGPVAISVI